MKVRQISYTLNIYNTFTVGCHYYIERKVEISWGINCKDFYFLAPTRIVPCRDRLTNCDEYSSDLCINPLYRLWREENCRKYCGVCTGRRYLHPRNWNQSVFVVHPDCCNQSVFMILMKALQTVSSLSKGFWSVSFDILSYSKAGTFVAMRLVSTIMDQPIAESLHCFNHSERRDVNN